MVLTSSSEKSKVSLAFFLSVRLCPYPSKKLKYINNIVLLLLLLLKNSTADKIKHSIRQTFIKALL